MQRFDVADVDPPEGHIRLDERSQHFQVGIVLQIRQFHAERIVRIRTMVKREGWEGHPRGPVLPERARSECARSTGAVGPLRVSFPER